MHKLDRFITVRNAVLALALFLLNAFLLGRLDQPLENLAGGEIKLDLRFGYDFATVDRLFTAYGEQGRQVYQWNLLVDTPFPILLSLATALFVLVAFRGRSWQNVLLIAPLVFAIFDLIENALLLALVRSYPDLSPGLVAFASLITQVKRTAFYLSALELIVSVLLTAFNALRNKLVPAGPPHLEP